jgi:hypothetical protein
MSRKRMEIWNVHILFNTGSVPISIYAHSVALVFQSYEPVWDLNLLLLIILYIVQFLTRKLLIQNACCFFTYRQSLPNFCKHKVVIYITDFSL